MKNVALFITFVIAVVLLFGCDKTKNEVSSDYKIVERTDMNYGVKNGEVVRIQNKVVINEIMPEAKLRSISEEIISNQKKLKPVNAVSLLFYLPETNIAGHYTAGKATWAPNGKWEDAGSVKTGNYSQHMLVIETGSALGEVPSDETGIPEDKRKEIFYELVAAQDKGVGDEEAYSVIAKKYDIDVKTTRKIASEGVVAGWPMP